MAQVFRCPALDFLKLSKPGNYGAQTESKGTGRCAARPPHVTPCFGVLEAPRDAGARGQCFAGMRAPILFLTGRRQTSQIHREVFISSQEGEPVPGCLLAGDDEDCRVSFMCHHTPKCGFGLPRERLLLSLSR